MKESRTLTSYNLISHWCTLQGIGWKRSRASRGIMQKAAPETVHEFLRNFFVAREKTAPRIKSHPTKTRGRWTSTRISLESIFLLLVCLFVVRQIMHNIDEDKYLREKKEKKFADNKISSIDRLKFVRIHDQILYWYRYIFVSKSTNEFIYHLKEKYDLLKGRFPRLEA